VQRLKDWKLKEWAIKYTTLKELQKSAKDRSHVAFVLLPFIRAGKE
jgi:hypothetical protein